MRVEFEVENLKSGNALYDAELRRRVESRKYPRITGEARTAEAIGPGRYRTTGEVRFHGVSKEMTGEITVTSTGERIVIEGGQTFDIRDFNVTPPKMLGLKVHPEVGVKIHVEAQPQS